MFCQEDGARFKGWCWTFFSISIFLTILVGYTKIQIFLGAKNLRGDVRDIERRHDYLIANILSSMTLVVFEDIPQIIMACLVIFKKPDEKEE